MDPALEALRKAVERRKVRSARRHKKMDEELNPDERLMLFGEPESAEELIEQLSRLVRAIEAEKSCSFHDDSGYHMDMKERGVEQFWEMANKYRSWLPEDWETMVERIY